MNSAVSKRLEQIIKKELSNTVIPIKTEDGVLVGDILIQNQGNLKRILKNGQILYKDIHLNKAAVAMANLLALRKNSHTIGDIYTNDQEYAKWFNESQHLKQLYEKSKARGEHDRADVYLVKYTESKIKSDTAKNKVERLAQI
jgi:hypothetical protein